MPLAVERMFYIDIEGVKLRGFIDRVDKLTGGGLSIVDYKTNQNLFTIADVKRDLQLTLYQLAAQETWNLPVERLTLYHLRTNTPCSCEARSGDQLEAARHTVLDVAENIVRGNFPATENQYCPCDFAEHCPYYRHQYSGVTSAVGHQEMLPGLVMTEAVEKYVSLQAEMKGLKAQLEEIRQEIIAYCQAEGLSRVFGEEHAITCKPQEKAVFDENGAREILEPEGLWDRVLRFDPAALKELLDDESLPSALRARLEGIRQVVTGSPRLWVRRIGGDEEE
jgi:hypothetical protein